MTILLKDFMKLFADSEEFIEVFDTTEDDWHRTLYEGNAWGFDFNTAIRGNVANEEVLGVFSYQTDKSIWGTEVSIGISNPSGR